MRIPARFESILPGLLATRPEYPFGGRAPAARAFLIERPSDDNGNKSTKQNVLLYASSHIGDYKEHITEMGGLPSHQLLTHRDEASKFCNVLDKNSQVFCHEKERAAIEGKGSRVDVTFEGSKHSLGDDLFAYHAPGHTPGVAIYLWQKDEDESILFTGDTIYGGEDGTLHYAPFFIHPYAEKKQDYIQTLALIRTIHPTFIVPGLSSNPDGNFLFRYDDTHFAKLEEQLRQEN